MLEKKDHDKNFMILKIKFCPKLEKRRYRLSEESVDTCVYPDNARSKMIQCYLVFHHFFSIFLAARYLCLKHWRLL